MKDFIELCFGAFMILYVLTHLGYFINGVGGGNCADNKVTRFAKYGGFMYTSKLGCYLGEKVE